MDSLFRQCFSCCIRARSRNSDGLDERSRLIDPPRDAVLPPAPTFFVDHQRLKERADAIVTSKRSMMVDVNSPLPFNLRNQARPLKFDPSTSRRPSDTSSGAGGSRMTSYSPTRSRDLSPSVQTSRSTASIHAGDASYSLAGDDPENGYKQPVFNARLIPVSGGFRVGGAGVRSAARGRLGRFGEERGRATPESQQRADESEDRDEVGIGGAPTENPSEFIDGEITRTPTIRSPSTFRPGDDLGSDRGTPDATEFRIRDVGKISCSWGD